MEKESFESRLSRLEEEIRKLRKELKAAMESGKITPEGIPTKEELLIPEEELHEPELVKAIPKEKPKPTKPLKPSKEVSELVHQRWLQFERIIGERWLVWVGALVFASGFSIFLKYAFDQGWLNQVSRFILGFFGGLVLIGFSEFLYKKKYKPFAQGISGLGLIILYLTIFTAYNFYHILVATPAFILFFVATIGGMTLAMLHNALPTAFLSIFGAFATPILLADPTSTAYYEPMLFSYLLIINLGVLYISLIKRWRILSFLSFLFTLIYFGGWYIREYTTLDFQLAIGFATTYFILFSFMSTPQSILRKKKSNWEDNLLIIINPIIFFLIIRSMFIDKGITEILFYVPLGMAVYHFFLARLVRGLNIKDIILYSGLVGTAVLLLTLPIPLIVRSYWITLCWGAEALFIILAGSKLNSKPIRIAGLVVFILVVFRLIFMDPFISYHGTDNYLLFLNLKSLILFLSALTFGIAAFIFGHFKNITLVEKNYTGKLWALFIASLFWILNVDIFSYFGALVPTEIKMMQMIFSSILWTAFSGCFLILGIIKDEFKFRLSGLILIGATAFKILLVDTPLLSSYNYGYPFLLNLKFLSLALLLGLITSSAFLYVKRGIKLEDKEKGAIPFLWTLFISLLFLGLNIEIISYFNRFEVSSIRLESFIYTTILWAIFSLFLIILGFRNKITPLRIVGIILITIAFIKVVFVDIAVLYKYTYGFPFLINLKFVSAAILLFTIAYAAMLYTQKEIKDVGIEMKAVPYLWTLFLILLFIEIHSQGTQSFYRVWNLSEQGAAFTLSLLWVLYGFGLLLVGILKKIMPLRIAALSLFGVTLCKVIFVDLRFTGIVYKMLILLGLGAIFLIASYFYRKYQKSIQEKK